MLARLLALFQEKVENRYYGKYRAIVTDNQDPEKRGRLKVKVPALLGETEIGWAMPCFPYGGGADRGFYMIPEAQDGIWVEFEAGQISFPIWSGTWWAQDETPKGADGAEPAPDLKLIKTKSGHVIQFDDSSGCAAITIVDQQGNKVVMDANGLSIDTASRDISVKGMQITLEATSVLNLKGATVNVEASGTATIKGASVSISP
jgi:hypothetical protein